MISELEKKAKAFATHHHTQQRKYTDQPYIVHPAAVVEIVRSVPHDEGMLCAAWLHDVVEDCGVARETIRYIFGDDVEQLVDELTDVATLDDGSRSMRAALNRAHTAKASPRAKTVKLADLIDNTSSIVEHDPAFAQIYMREKALVLPLLLEGDSLLFQRASTILLQWQLDQQHKELK